MSLFEPEEVPVFSHKTARRLDDTFKQKPTIVPLTPYPQEVVIAQQHNIVPIVAIVGLLSFFGFLAFLVFMRKT